MNDPPSETIVPFERLRAGDRGALAELFQRHRDRLREDGRVAALSFVGDSERVEGMAEARMFLDPTFPAEPFAR